MIFIKQPVLSIGADTVLMVAIVLVVVVQLCGCQRSDSSHVAAETNTQAKNPLVIQPQGLGKVPVSIKSAVKCTAAVFRITGNESTLVQELPLAASHNLELDSGFYEIRWSAANHDSNMNSDSHRDKQTANSIPVPELAPIPKPEPGWRWIPAGPAIIGDTLGVGREDERPARIVDVASFWMAKKETTNDQYAEFLSAQDQIDDRWIDLESRKCLIQKQTNGEAYAAAPNVEHSGQMPVVMVSLSGALAYCDWLEKKTGQLIRLPNEIEWEKSARGPESFVYSYGNIYKQALANQESGELKPVGSYQPNSFGLYDMTGNVFEWMSNQNDASSDKIYNQSLRGGSFVLDGMYLRNSFRMRQSKSVMTDDIGFRVAKDPN